MYSSRLRRVVTYKTVGFSADRAGVGSSSLLGDAGVPYLPVPDFLPINGSRFLFLLCVASVAPGEVARLRRFRLTATIAQTAQVSLTPEPPEPSDAWRYTVAREIVSPWWSFPDGNITYYLRVLPPNKTFPAGPSPAQPSVQRAIYATSPALLAMTYDPTLRIYVPPAGGVPPGAPVAGLDRISDQLGVWQDAQHADFAVSGPARICIFASVKQTDPGTRPYLPTAQYPLGAFSQGLRPEDEFLLSWGEPPHNLVRYHGVAAAMELEHEDFPLSPCKQNLASGEKP